MSDLPDNNTEESVRWLRQSEEELLVARHLHADAALPPRAACFHAHLAAEKALKALLIRIECPFRKTHDLDELVGLLGDDAPSELVPGLLVVLAPWELGGRYPDAVAEASHEDAIVSLDVAAKVVAAVRSRFEHL